MKLLKMFTKDKEQVKSDIVDGILRSIVNNIDYDFTYEEQSEILTAVNEKFLENNKEKRNALITEARQIQNILTEK